MRPLCDERGAKRLPRENGSEPLKTGVSDVNKEAFQGGTLHITCVGKCANPERGFVFSQTFNPTRLGERPAIHRTYIFGDTLLLLLLLCLTVHTPQLSLSLSLLEAHAENNVTV